MQTESELVSQSEANGGICVGQKLRIVSWLRKFSKRKIIFLYRNSLNQLYIVSKIVIRFRIISVYNKAALAYLVKRRVILVIERLLTPGAILELTMRRCVLRKTLYAYFPVKRSSLPVMVAQLDKGLARTKKRMSYVKEAECLVHTNERVCAAIESVLCSMLLKN